MEHEKRMRSGIREENSMQFVGKRHDTSRRAAAAGTMARKVICIGGSHNRSRESHHATESYH